MTRKEFRMIASEVFADESLKVKAADIEKYENEKAAINNIYIQKESELKEIENGQKAVVLEENRRLREEIAVREEQYINTFKEFLMNNELPESYTRFVRKLKIRLSSDIMNDLCNELNESEMILKSMILEGETLRKQTKEKLFEERRH